MNKLWTDRIVMWGNSVIAPEHVENISIQYNMVKFLCDGAIAERYIGNARRDRATGMLDKNGKEIFENDTIAYLDKYGTVMFLNGKFMVKWPNIPGHYNLSLVAEYAVVTGHVPWEESHE